MIINVLDGAMHISHLKPQEKTLRGEKRLINHLLANLITQVLVFL